MHAMPGVASKAFFGVNDSFLVDDFDDSSEPHDNHDDGEIVPHPNPEDVLLGRGKSNQKHPGNILFRALINQNRASYFASVNNAQKKEVTTRVLSGVTGRFLKKLSGKSGWVVVTGNPRRIKVAQALQYRQRISDECPLPTRPMASHMVDVKQSTFSQLMSFRQAQKQAIQHSLAKQGIKDSQLQSTDKPLLSDFTVEGVRVRQGDDKLQKVLELFEPYKNDEPRLCTKDELLWALGYPIQISNEDANLSDHQPQLASLESSIAPLSCDNQVRLALACGANENGHTFGLEATSFNRRSAMEPSLSQVDIFATLEHAGFLSRSE